MVIQKTTVYKVLTIVLALLLLVGSSERVEAADEEEISTGEFICNDNGFLYSYTDKLVFGNQRIEFSHPVYLIVCRKGTNGNYFAASKEDFTCSYLNVNGKYGKGESNGIYFLEGYGTGFNTEFNIPINENDDPGSIISAFKSYVLNGGEFDFNSFKPDFYNCVGKDPLLTLDNLQADIVEDDLILVWEQPKIMPFRMMKNMFVQFRYSHRDPESYHVGRVKYIDMSQYAAISDGSITIPLSEIDTLPENHQISSIVATPYYYYADNIESGEMIRGQATQIYFDVYGLSSAPILVNPDIKEEIPEENVEHNIFQSINNFFSGFFSNLISTIKSAVVPSGDDVLALLQEMNDWFSERFGFIWYPFDLAIDIMAAFALGEPDSKITVPALTLNMLGGIKLWDSFEADLDPIGFMQYVRFFTSAIMCCGTVSLAIRKWDEWIGGEH